MGTTEKLKAIKEVMAISFMQATEKSLVNGLQFGYTSRPEDDIFFGNTDAPTKGWVVDIKVKEAGYGEKIIQQFRYPRPDSVDAKNFEYHVLIDVLSALVQGALISWYELGKVMATDKEFQKEVIDEAKKGNIATN